MKPGGVAIAKITFPALFALRQPSRDGTDALQSINLFARPF
jgi:hypothetical protein